MSSSDLLCSLQNTVDNFTGGKVLCYLNNWECLSSDPMVLNIVHGNVLEFSSLPVQTVPPRPLCLSKLDSVALDEAM